MILSGDSPSLPVAQQIEGWEARFIGQEPRLSEVIEMYREIGYEVRVQQFSSIGCDDCCKSCFDESVVPQMVVYTRIKNNEEDDFA